mgnify:FL=1
MIEINAEKTEVNLSATMLQLYASQYIKCANEFIHDGFSPVYYSLYCKAIELGLKAIHLETKTIEQIPSDYGHDIKNSYDGLEESSKTLGPHEYAELTKASEIYNAKGFEYCRVKDSVQTFTNFPDFRVLRKIAEQFVEKNI